LVKSAHLGLVAALVVVVADMAWLVEILNAMKQEAQRETALRDRLALIPHKQPELTDFVDNAPL
jgi:hypothetical protein